MSTLQPVQRDVLDTQDHWHSLHILPYRTVDDQIDGVVLTLQNIDAVKAASEQAKKAGELFSAIINTVRQPLIVLDSDLRVMMFNQSFLQTFKVSKEETANKFLYRLGNEQWNIPRLRALLEEVLPKDQVVTNFEVDHKFEHIGRRRIVLNARTLTQLAGREPMILLALEDITQRKQSEAALIRSEKLAASGRLAAALAHEINNPLQAVTNLMALLERSTQLSQQDHEYATLAARETGRIVRLVQQSLGFYRATASPAAMNLEEVLESVLVLYDRRIKTKQLDLTKQYRSQGTLWSYPSEIRQVFSTLLVNAMEACSKGCRVVLRTSDSRDWRNGNEPKGVRITVADNGVGIQAEYLARVFEPFFTTKGEKGTGLGLWVARGIIDRLGGSIQLRSRTTPGSSGTCFSIFLPSQRPD